MQTDLFNLDSFVSFHNVWQTCESEGGFSVIGDVKSYNSFLRPKIEKTKSQRSDDWIFTKIKQHQ